MSKQLNNARANLERLKSSLTLSQADTADIKAALDRLERAESQLEGIAIWMGLGADRADLLADFFQDGAKS